MIDLFGRDVSILKDDDNHFILSARTSRTDDKFLAQQYLDFIEIVFPKNLREEFTKEPKEAME